MLNDSYSQEQYKEILEAIRPFYPNNPSKAYFIVTKKVGPIFNDVLIQLLWRQLELEIPPNWADTLPYEVIVQRFNMN